MNKRLMIILDGLGDCPCPVLDGGTPLEAARTPNLDRLVEHGRCGLVDPIGPGVRVGTHIGVGVLMGLSPGDALNLGRGPVEAAGIDLPLGEGDIALRCNLATLLEHDGVLYIHDRRAGRVCEESAGLLAELEDLDLGDGIRATVRPATQHRAVLRLCGEGLSPAVGNTDPGDTATLPARVQPCLPQVPRDPSAQRTAAAVSRLVQMAFGRLKEHPLNLRRLARGEPPATGLITRSAGSVHSLRNVLREQGLRVAVVSAESTVIGLGRLFGFTLLNDTRFTAMMDTDLDAKLRVAKDALAEHDLVFLHVKGTDVCAHDREPRAKRDFIERIDAALAGLAEEGIVVAVTADHSTDSNTGSHTSDPVPSLLYAPGGARDDRDVFGESDCRDGGLGRMSAEQFLATFLAVPAE
jgi:2,3-bisphosphoglycerate-independent phosphoglycerate mutase